MYIYIYIYITCVLDISYVSNIISIQTMVVDLQTLKPIEQVLNYIFSLFQHTLLWHLLNFYYYIYQIYSIKKVLRILEDSLYIFQLKRQILMASMLIILHFQLSEYLPEKGTGYLELNIIFKHHQTSLGFVRIRLHTTNTYQ